MIKFSKNVKNELKKNTSDNAKHLLSKPLHVCYNSNIKKVNTKDEKISSITLDNGTSIDVTGVFIYVGYKPATEFVPNIILDDEGYVKVNEKLETKINGVYAAGDVIKKDTYQLITAASDGARVITNMKQD